LAAGYLVQLVAQIRHVSSRRALLQERVIVVNEFGCEVMPIAYRIAMPRAKIVAIVHTHPGQDDASSNPVRCLIERLCYRSVTELVFNSCSTKELWQKKLGLTQIRGRVIWYGLEDVEFSVPEDYPEKTKGCVDVLYLAQFYGWKGQLEFLHVWQSVTKRISGSARLVMIGDGVVLPACREYVSSAGLSDSVVFLGQKPNGSAYLNGGDVLVHLPIEHEAFGLVTIEAMRAALPVVASKLGGIPEIVKEGDTGVLVDPMNEAQVSDAVCSMIQDPQLRRRMGGRGRERWQAEFTRDHMLTKYDQLFNELSAR